MDKALTADFSAVYTPSVLDVIRQSRSTVVIRPRGYQAVQYFTLNILL